MENTTPPGFHDNNAPAFPVPDSYIHKGITVRQWFAGMALTGLINPHTGYLPSTMETISEEAFKIADTMIKQSKK